jgi:hypothetical protein
VPRRSPAEISCTLDQAHRVSVLATLSSVTCQTSPGVNEGVQEFVWVLDLKLMRIKVDGMKTK